MSDNNSMSFSLTVTQKLGSAETSFDLETSFDNATPENMSALLNLLKESKKDESFNR